MSQILKITKTMKPKFLYLICAGIGAIAINLIPSLPANSQPAVPPSSPPTNVLKSLNLSDVQKRQIQAILEKGKESRRASIQELRTRQQELRTMMDRNTPREVLTEKFNQIQNLRRQNEQKRFGQMLAMREVLTPQQRSQLSKAVRDARRNWRERRGRRFSGFDNEF